MPRQVKTPDGVMHSFPDDATDAEISAALNAPPATARTTPEGKPRSWVDTAVDALPMAGGALGGLLGAATGIPTLGLTSAPGAIVGAGVLGAGGEAAKQLINRARGKEAPATPTDAATDIALQGGGQAVGEAVGQQVVKGVGAVGKAVYRGYLKPSLAARALPKGAQVVQTAIDEALPVTASGSAQAQKVIGELRGQVDQVLAASPESVDLTDVASKIRAFAKQRYYKPGADLSDYQTAMAVADRIDSHPSLALPAPAMPRTAVSLPEANQIKRALDTSAGEAAFGVKSGAEKTTEKYARAQMRGAMEAKAPAIAPLNARESKLIDAAKAIDRAVGRESNKNAISGVTSMIGMAYGGSDYYRHGDPYAAAAKGLALKVALSPEVATRAAIVAARLGQTSGAAVNTVARVAIQAVSEAQQDPQDVPDKVQEQGR